MLLYQMKKPMSLEHKQLKSNFLALTVLQAANYLLPLITFPYLVKTLGIEYFGLLAFATAIIAYFGIITDYGFNLTATKEISIHREDKEKVIEIFSAVMSIKLMLMLVSFLLLSILVFSFQHFSKEWLVYLLTFGTILGQFLFPVWFFQGMEKMKYITYLNLISKSLFTIAIFVFIQEKSDYYLVPLFISSGAIIAGSISLYVIYKYFNISFKIQSKETIKYYLVDGWHVFLSRFYVSLYTTTNIILLGLFTNNMVVGYYSIAEKIVLAFGGLFEPLNQTLYPYLARKYKENFGLFVSILKKASLIFLAIALLLLLLSEYFKNEIILLVNGSYNNEISLLLSIFLIRILIFPFGALLSNALIIMQRKKEFMKVMNYTVFLDLLLVFPAIYYFDALGLIVAFVTVLLMHVALLVYYVNQSLKLEALNFDK